MHTYIHALPYFNMYSAGVRELFAPSNVLHQVSYIHLIAVSTNMVVCMCVCKYGPPNACMYVCVYVCMYTNICLVISYLSLLLFSETAAKAFADLKAMNSAVK